MFCEGLTLSTVFSLMDVGDRYHTINYGVPGSGKSRSTYELINLIGKNNVIVLDNTTTKRGFFEHIMNYPNSHIFMDECSTFLKDKGAQDMVKAVMEGKCLTWTKNKTIEKTRPFTGNLIINANVTIDDPIVDRCFMNKTTSLNRNELVLYNDMVLSQHNMDFTPFINHIRNITYSKTYQTLNEDELILVKKFIAGKAAEGAPDEQYSRRTLIRVGTFVERCKNLFGSLDAEVLTFIGDMTENYISQKRPQNNIEKIISEGEIEKPELIRRLMKETRYSDRQARRIIDKKIADGELVLKGKLVMLNE